MAPSEDSETWRGGRVQVEEVVSNKDLLSLLIPGEGLDDILEIGVIPWSYKIKEARKDGVQNWLKILVGRLCFNSELWLWFWLFHWMLSAASRK